MAHLTDSDRGQIIIVAAFALGVIFIALAVVVNTAIFTGNLATRGQGTSDDDALQYRHEIEQSVGTVITEINRQHDGNDSTHLKNWAKENVTEINIQGGRQKATNGRVATIDYASIKNGTRFVNESKDFTAVNGSTTWQVASNASARALKINITNRTALNDSRSDAFTLSLNGSNDNHWNMSIYNDTTGRANVTVSNGDGEVASCTRSGSGSLEIAVTRGLVDGRPCSALTIDGNRDMWFGSGISERYNITYDNADEIEGDYEGVVDDGLNETNLPPNSGSSSKSNAAIYSLNVSYSYETVSMRYETNVRVAPGEPE